MDYGQKREFDLTRQNTGAVQISHAPEVRACKYGLLLNPEQSTEEYDTGYLLKRNGQDYESVGWVAQDMQGRITTVHCQTREDLIWRIAIGDIKNYEWI